MSTSPLMRSASAGSLCIRSRTSSSAMCPPVLDPTRICLPEVTRVTTRVSSSQSPIVASSKRPLERPWPE